MVINIDNNDTAIKEEEQVIPEPELSEVSPTEEQPEEVAEVIEEADSTEEVETVTEAEETGGESKKGYTQRVREVVNERNEARREIESLKEKIEQLTGLNQPMVGQIPYQQQAQDDSPIVAPGEEIDGLELDRRLRMREQRLLQRVETMAELKSKQTEAINRINNETVEVLKNFPELDPESDDFNKDLSDSITEATEAYVKSNPYGASVKSFVSKLMKPYKGAVSKEVGRQTEVIAKQASQASLKPTSVKQGEKDASEKSIAELEAELGVVNG